MTLTEIAPTILNLPNNQRVASIENEIYSKGHCYLAEDVARRQLLVVAQRMVNVQRAIEEQCGESISLASLFESATMKLRKGKTGSFRVVRLPPSEVPSYLDERRGHYDRLVIAATVPDKWRLAQVC